MGERLFRDDGTQTAVVERAVSLLRNYQRLHAETQAFAAQVREWELLDPKQAEVKMSWVKRCP